MSLAGKVVLITGGAANIGRGAALAFAREGAKVMVADFDAIAGRDTLSELQDVTADCAWVRVDLAHEDQVARMVEMTRRRFGRIDVLVHNAGNGVASVPIEEIDWATFESGFTANARGCFLAMKHVLPLMIEQRGGSIVATASIQAVISVGDFSYVYGAAKAGILALVRHVSVYYGPHGIRANAVCPGHILTPTTRERFEAANLGPQYPLRRMGEIREIADAYVWLAGEQSSFVTGTTFLVDGGWTAR